MPGLGRQRAAATSQSRAVVHPTVPPPKQSVMMSIWISALSLLLIILGKALLLDLHKRA